MGLLAVGSKSVQGPLQPVGMMTDPPLPVEPPVPKEPPLEELPPVPLVATGLTPAQPTAANRPASAETFNART